MPLDNGAINETERLDALVARGEIPGEEVQRARAYREAHLSHGIDLPTGARATLSAWDCDHILRVDPRIRRKPDRLRNVLEHVFELRQTYNNRVRGLSRWQEGDQEVYGFVILGPEHQIITMHLIRRSELSRLSRQGIQLWPRDES